MAKYRIQIDRELCDGDMLCSETAPNTFRVDEDGCAVVINPDGDPPEDILAAAQNCPFEAVTLFDSATGRQVWPPVQ